MRKEVSFFGLILKRLIKFFQSLRTCLMPGLVSCALYHIPKGHSGQSSCWCFQVSDFIVVVAH